MKVVHIGYKYGLNNTGGASIAATRLHNALLSQGMESHYVCIWQCEEGVNVHVLPRKGGVLRWIYFFLTKTLRGFWRFTSWRQSIPLNLIPMYGLESLLDNIKPDIIHVHWIKADVISFSQLAHLKYKVVINLHDLFMINILESHPDNDLRYVDGVTSENSSIVERWLFARKKKAVCNLRPSFVGPSKWVCECASKSIIGRSQKIHFVSNIIDEDFLYRPELRTKHERFIILFGGYGGRRNMAKGFNDLERALMFLPKSVKDKSELLIFGEEAQDCETAGIVTHFAGKLTSKKGLVKTYHKADVFVFPSIHETQGMTKIEAMLCGLPVISFDRTACAEGIENGVTGWVVKDGDLKGFANSINKQYDIAVSGLSDDEIHGTVALRAKELFDEAVLVKRMVRVYRETFNQ